MISVRGLNKRYREGDGTVVEVLRNLSLEVDRGEFAVVTGASGSGKSTLLQILGTLDTDYEGEVTVAGERLAALSEPRRAHFRNREVGFVFQSFHLIAGMTALENVALPSFFAAGPSNVRKRATRALERVGLESKLGRTPAQLSGGERQRVALARALFSAPSLLLCDEPTGNLDAATGDGIVALLKALNRDEGLTILGVTHEEKMRQAASRVWSLSGGLLQLGGSA